ncbi:MAG: Ada metal-binding domain-containing protein [Candidatus Woesearchaeota archaeon]
MKGIIIGFLGVFLQLVGAISFYNNANFFGLAISVIGATLVFIMIANFALKKSYQIFIVSSTLLFLVIITLDLLLDFVSFNYVFMVALLAIVLIMMPFSKLTKRKVIRTKKQVQKEVVNEKEQMVIALKNGTIFHRLNCPLIQKSKKQNLIYFKSAKEAISKGYRPCKMCDPQ